MNEVDEFILEHYGKKGMRWGIRNSSARKALTRHAQKSVSGRSARVGRKIGKSIREHPVATKRVVKGAGVGVAVVGATFAAQYLASRGNITLSRAKSTNHIDVGSRVVKTIFDKKAILPPAKMLLRGV